MIADPNMMKAKGTLTPWAISRALGKDPYEWQLKVLSDIILPWSRTTLSAANESGKTTEIIAPIVIWHAMAFKNSKCVLTSGAWRQVTEQLFPAISRYRRYLSGWDITANKLTTPHGSMAIGFSTDDAGKFEGWHAEDHDLSPLLIIVDEAKTVKKDIFEAIARCRPTRLLYASSPGGCSGEFYDSHTRNASMFNRHKVTAFDCPHIPRAQIDEARQKYGEDSPLYKSMILGEFMEDGEDGIIIPVGILNRCKKEAPAPNTDPEVHAFCDFAAGGDENVLAVRRGNEVKLIRCWRETNTMAATGEFIALFQKENLKPEMISGDEGGLGHVICDRLQELGWPISRVNNGSMNGVDRRLYFNKGAQIWGEGRNQIDRLQVILPDDDDLHSQLSTRLWERDSDGSLKVEPKPKMKARNLPSPDRADAVLGCMMPSPTRQIAPVSSWVGDDFQTNKEVKIENQLQGWGMDVGN